MAHVEILFFMSQLLKCRKQAIERLQYAANLAGEHIPKKGWAQSIASWGMGYFVSQSPTPCISEKELSW